MRLAIRQAQRGLGRTSPNPCVGAVIVRGKEIVGKGFHRKAGTPHAEVNAIADAGVEACKGATIYVTLEPCNHTGKTPPCSRAVLAAGLRRVVVGMPDPHDLASGGAEFLQSRGVAVTIGVLEEECRNLNRPFLKYINTGLPWVVMKAGMSLDGKISTRLGKGGAITGAAARMRVHELRNTFDAILIGIDTALIDNPSLTTRLPHGGRDPLRIILDSRLRLSPEARILRQQSDNTTWIFCGNSVTSARKKDLEQAGVVVTRVDSLPGGSLNLRHILQILGRADVLSVLVEGGAGVHGSFVKEKLVDEVFLFTAPYFIGDAGTPLIKGYSLADNGRKLELEDFSCELLGDDLLLHGIVALNHDK
ncbi:MAG: bifunctional diaminohydroxyphosphoribosylaminopyrimidine deaminase/5-amino-6-(5-phosphoribosylamino)uracil reductase RibD [Desulfobulbus sp.]|nr:MAG: bifunctional diaminohydroxyphosphoribosylaminopyrimidine deaminase/5-amino-6-(5-phosphoribosylamino)uracil reductase RibD [Desulfobulbus sp.]